MNRGKDTCEIWFRTNRDRMTLFELIKRSDLGLRSPEVSHIEKIKNRKKDCQRCGDNKADFRIIRRRSEKKYYTDYFCLSCIEESLNDWLENMVEYIEMHLTRCKVARRL